MLTLRAPSFVSFFFFNDTATTEIYTLSLHDALPIWRFACRSLSVLSCSPGPSARRPTSSRRRCTDRKSTRLNSSHGYISYAVFCLKKKKKTISHLRSQRMREPPQANAPVPLHC